MAGASVLVDVGEGLGDEVVGGDLDRLRQSLPNLEVKLDRDARPLGKGFQRTREAGLVDDRRVDAPGQFTELGQRIVELSRRVGDELGHDRVPCDLAAGQAEHQGQSDQALLGAVVEVALHPPKLPVTCVDDSGPRCVDLGELRVELGLESLIVDRQRRRLGDSLEPLGVIQQGAIVDQAGDRLPATGDGGERSAVDCGGRRSLAELVDPATGPDSGVDDIELRVAKRPPERVTHLSPALRVPRLTTNGAGRGRRSP
ncbi:MAG TPA: hypothetical protein VM262_18500 [Acidimicrobiales bacterium]|nr:hypothetical protein [Acidimicrobiales bacterium]